MASSQIPALDKITEKSLKKLQASDDAMHIVQLDAWSVEEGESIRTYFSKPIG